MQERDEVEQRLRAEASVWDQLKVDEQFVVRVRRKANQVPGDRVRSRFRWRDWLVGVLALGVACLMAIPLILHRGTSGLRSPGDQVLAGLPDLTPKSVPNSGMHYPPGIRKIRNPVVPAGPYHSSVPDTGPGYSILAPENAPIATGKTSSILVDKPKFVIRGVVYEIPAQFRRDFVLVLPLNKGIAWAVVQRNRGRVARLPDIRSQPNAFKGTTAVYYTPYSTRGGSLFASVWNIGSVPHEWSGYDSPVLASAWSGWIGPDFLAPAKVVDMSVQDMTMGGATGTKVLSSRALRHDVPGWGNWLDATVPTKTMKPYWSEVDSLTRIQTGFLLRVTLMDGAGDGENAGLNNAFYAWSENTGKWTPITQVYGVQTITGWLNAGARDVYWEQALPAGNNHLYVAYMRYDPLSNTISTVPIRQWYLWDSFVDGTSWLFQKAYNAHQWVVYTPPPA